MGTWIRVVLAAWLAIVAGGCASVRVPAPLPPTELFSDHSVAPPSSPATTANLFALSPAMRAYLHSPRFASMTRFHGKERGLVQALYQNGELKLEYDASVTRNAADTYDARMGNCLSLVIMTAAFAKELGMTVQYNDVAMDEVWTRSDDMLFSNTHVNLTLGRQVGSGYRSFDGAMLTVDFIASREGASFHSRQIDEDTITAMYMNNRAAELMSARKFDDAYWWARNLLAQFPDHLNGYNTLGVVYQRRGDLPMAEKVFRAALLREPENIHVMHNLVPVLAKLGKDAESKQLAARVATLDPTPAFHYFRLGQTAMAKGDYAEAKRLFNKEVRRSPYYHEFHFWLALAQLGLGEAKGAREQLHLARDTSNTVALSRRYSAKLEHLRTLARRPVVLN